MFFFHSIKELINALSREKDLLSELFEKRKIPFRQDYALDLVDSREDRLEFLKERGVIRPNGAYVELDDEFLQFFELILDVNEEINTSYVHENIQQIRQNILYYLQEGSAGRRYSYLRNIKSSLRKTGRITLRNIMDLNRNVEYTFKTEPTYKIKIAKLQDYDRKREDISAFLEKTEKLLLDDEQTFFKTAMDEELKQITLQLRIQINEFRHNLIEIQKQIIEYLNQIKYQGKVMEKLRRVKYLKDQFELRTKTDIEQVLARSNGVAFEPNPAYPLKLSLGFLQQDGAYQALVKVARKAKTNSGAPSLPLAGEIPDDYLQTGTERETIVDLDEVKRGFSASGNHLFNFVMSYPFEKEVPFEERVTIFCRLVSLFETELNITETYNRHQELEYVVVYPG